MASAMNQKRYKLSEEICVQSLHVAFKRSEWKEWFVNPTAGPWKKIRIEGVEDNNLLRFRKEEARPDLILCHESKLLTLILEAKDDINKLISASSNQVQKSVGVFKSMFNRLEAIFDRYKESIFGASSVELEFLCGYLFPAWADLRRMKQGLLRLDMIHKNECQRINEQRLVPHVVFLTTSDADRNLHVIYSLRSCNSHVSAKAGELFPSTVNKISSHDL